MRTPEFLSPSQLSTFKANPDEYYIKYLRDTKMDKIPQTNAMAVGSAFDAYVKSHLYAMLVGTSSPKHTFEALFEAQVEPHNRDVARLDGLTCFRNYQETGALADLMLWLGGRSSECYFEFEIRGAPDLSILNAPSLNAPSLNAPSLNAPNLGVHSDLVLLGKPDLYFLTGDMTPIVFDWKVNGFYSKSGVSPKRGYIRKFTKNRFGTPMVGDGHKDSALGTHRGVQINVAENMESIDKEWATQISTYGWLMGAKVGSEFVAAIDQLAWRGGELTVACLRNKISRDFQIQVLKDYVDLWERIKSGWFFRDRSEEESKRYQQALDKMSNFELSFTREERSYK